MGDHGIAGWAPPAFLLLFPAAALAGSPLASEDRGLSRRHQDERAVFQSSERQARRGLEDAVAEDRRIFKLRLKADRDAFERSLRADQRAFEETVKGKSAAEASGPRRDFKARQKRRRLDFDADESMLWGQFRSAERGRLTESARRRNNDEAQLKDRQLLEREALLRRHAEAGRSN